MIRKFLLGGIILGSLSMGGCSWIFPEGIDPGYVGVLINTRGDNAGLDRAQLVRNSVWIGLNQQLVKLPETIKAYSFTSKVDEGNPVDESISFNAKGGVPVKANVSIQLRVVNGVKFVQAFNKRELEDVVATNVRNDLRDKLGVVAPKYTPSDLVSEKKAELYNGVKAALNLVYASRGIEIVSVGFNDNPEFPKEVQEAITATETARQQVERSVKEKDTAEAQLKTQSVLNQIEDLKSKTLTPQILQDKWIEKWDGKGPTTIIGKDGGTVPTFNLNK